MNILGISAYYHDSAACLVCDGHLTAAAQEERFTRRKHDSGFPVNAVRYCLAEGNVPEDGIDAVVFTSRRAWDAPLVSRVRSSHAIPPVLAAPGGVLLPRESSRRVRYAPVLSVVGPCQERRSLGVFCMRTSDSGH